MPRSWKRSEASATPQGVNRNDYLFPAPLAVVVGLATAQDVHRLPYRPSYRNDLLELQDMSDATPALEGWTFNLIKDGIHHRYRAPLLRGWLCKFGFHRWQYWHMAVRFIQMLPKQANVCRDCVHCRWMEMTDDGRKWKWRI